MCIICVYVVLSACLRFDFVYVCLLSSGFGSLVPVVVFIGFEIGEGVEFCLLVLMHCAGLEPTFSQPRLDKHTSRSQSQL